MPPTNGDVPPALYTCHFPSLCATRPTVRPTRLCTPHHPDVSHHPPALLFDHLPALLFDRPPSPSPALTCPLLCPPSRILSARPPSSSLAHPPSYLFTRPPSRLF